MKHLLPTCITLILFASTWQFCNDVPPTPDFNQRKKFYFEDTQADALTYLKSLDSNKADILYTLHEIAEQLYSTYTGSFIFGYTYTYLTKQLMSTSYQILKNLKNYADAIGSNNNSVLQQALNTIQSPEEKKDALTAYFIAIEESYSAPFFEYARIWNTFITTLKTKIDNTELHNFLTILNNNQQANSFFYTIAPQNWDNLTNIPQADDLITNYTLLQEKKSAAEEVLKKITGDTTALQNDLDTVQKAIPQQAPRTAGAINYELLSKQLDSLVEKSNDILKKAEDQFKQEETIQQQKEKIVEYKKTLQDYQTTLTTTQKTLESLQEFDEKSTLIQQIQATTIKINELLTSAIPLEPEKIKLYTQQLHEFITTSIQEQKEITQKINQQKAVEEQKEIEKENQRQQQKAELEKLQQSISEYKEKLTKQQKELNALMSRLETVQPFDEKTNLEQKLQDTLKTLTTMLKTSTPESLEDLKTYATQLKDLIKTNNEQQQSIAQKIDQQKAVAEQRKIEEENQRKQEHIELEKLQKSISEYKEKLTKQQETSTDLLNKIKSPDNTLEKKDNFIIQINTLKEAVTKLLKENPRSQSKDDQESFINTLIKTFEDNNATLNAIQNTIKPPLQHYTKPKKPAVNKPTKTQKETQLHPIVKQQQAEKEFTQTSLTAKELQKIDQQQKQQSETSTILDKKYELIAYDLACLYSLI